MKLFITMLHDENGMLFLECPSIPGCISQGKTEEEAEKNIHDAIKGCIEARAKIGMPHTVMTREVKMEI